MTDLRSEMKALGIMFPKIPVNNRTLGYMAVGWVALATFFIWLPLAFAYVFFWILYQAGKMLTAYFAKGVMWANETSLEEAKAAEKAAREAAMKAHEARTANQTKRPRPDGVPIPSTPIAGQPARPKPRDEPEVDNEPF